MGSITAVCGVLVMALPIPIVVDNFADYYSEQKKLEAMELKAEAQVIIVIININIITIINTRPSRTSGLGRSMRPP